MIGLEFWHEIETSKQTGRRPGLLTICYSTYYILWPVKYMKVFAGFIINAQTLFESGFYKGRGCT